MKKILVTIFVLSLAASLCYAAEGDAVKATEPAGAVVETGGVIVGKITNVVERSLGGGKTEQSLVMADDAGRTKIIPLDDTVKFLDGAFNVITLKQLRTGEKVSVEYTKAKDGTEKAKSVQVVK